MYLVSFLFSTINILASYLIPIKKINICEFYGIASNLNSNLVLFLKLYFENKFVLVFTNKFTKLSEIHTI